MSVPTHNLYEFVHQFTENKYWLKYFYPWGSRNLLDVVALYPSNTQDQNEYIFSLYDKNMFIKKLFPQSIIKHINFVLFQPVLFCHDQEPLNYELYQNSKIDPYLLKKWGISEDYKINLNLRYAMPPGVQEKWILLHSELNSKDLNRYENSGMFQGAYWWCHAFLARDWYRFAQYDTSINHQNTLKRFLVYCREINGSRTYRKEFLNKLYQNNCMQNTQLGSFNNNVFHKLDYHGKWRTDRYYKLNDVVEYKNKIYKCIDSLDASNHWNSLHWQEFEIPSYGSDASATYESYDFAHTDLSVILETVFDDRIHLTEKTLRAIACKHPFIIAAGPNSLQYLKGYGFKTFSPYINESYDDEKCHSTRLNMIVNELKRLNSLSDEEYKKTINECKKIAEHNHKVFFSNQFYQSVVDELKSNVNKAVNITKNNISWQMLWKLHKDKKKYRPHDFYQIGDHHKQRISQIKLIRHLKKGGTLEDYVPPDLD